jgi:hypothetical protein
MLHSLQVSSSSNLRFSLKFSFSDRLVDTLTAEFIPFCQVHHSESKKRRVGSTTRPAFEASLTQLNSWMAYMEAALSLSKTTNEQGPFDGLSVEEQLVMYKDMETDVQNHKGEVDRVVALGKRLVEEVKSGKFMCILYLLVWCFVYT